MVTLMSALVEHLGDDTATVASSAANADVEGGAGRRVVLDFVRTPFSVRRNMVRVWKPLPDDIWTALTEPPDRRLAGRREAVAIGCVTLMSAAIAVAGLRLGVTFSSDDGPSTMYPLIGPGPVDGSVIEEPTESAAETSGRADVPLGSRVELSPRSGELPSARTGWTIVPPASAPAIFWTVVPPLLGWWTVRRVWIPASMARSGDSAAAMTFARHLSGVYLYVFLMVTAGLVVGAMLLHLAPASTQRWRWWLWLFLFGETFFVPAVMWTRLVSHDRMGRVFGRRRRAALAAYLAAFVAVPVAGMARFVFFP